MGDCLGDVKMFSGDFKTLFMKLSGHFLKEINKYRKLFYTGVKNGFVKALVSQRLFKGEVLACAITFLVSGTDTGSTDWRAL